MGYIILIVMVIVGISLLNKDDKRRYHRKYYYYDDYEEHYNDSLHDCFQDGISSKADIELMMEDNDIREKFYEDF